MLQVQCRRARFAKEASRTVARVSELVTWHGSVIWLLRAVSITGETTPLPPPAASEEKDEALFAEAPWVEPPIHVDYGRNIKLADNVMINFNCTILDTCLVTVGARTLIASNVSLISATHPLDPDVRNGTKGPELGKEIHIGDDCWIGASAVILPGVTIGRGSTVGAGSVVTKVLRPIGPPNIRHRY